MSIKRVCGPCSGQGYYNYDRKDTCKVCGGVGAIVLPGQSGDYKVCGPCSGQGYYNYDRKDTCKVCGGVGMNAVSGPSVAKQVPGQPAPRSSAWAPASVTNATPERKQEILVLISHSSKDSRLAEGLIDLLRSGLNLLANQIRCSSVAGYKLPAGVDTAEQLREEIRNAKIFIGLLTPRSLHSTYVLFELGARWGSEMPMIPLLASVKPEEMAGPHNVLNALSCHVEGDLFQLVEEVGRRLERDIESAQSYLGKVQALIRLAASGPGP